MARLKNTPRDQNPPDPPPGTSTSSQDIFSYDKEEIEFLDHVAQERKRAWIGSKMTWNTIHTIPWKRCEKLGQGAFGSVYLGMRRDNKLFAVKSIAVDYPITRKVRSRIECQITEIKMMRCLRSKYIVRCLGCGRSNGANSMDGNETLDVFLEYLVRGSLAHVMKTRKSPFEETPYVRQYTYDILKALQYMVQQQVVHGDIKLSNLLLSDDCVKLADWGGAKQLTPSTLTTLLIGTKGFKSPEVFHKRMQGHPSDIFSLGCTVIEMLTGDPPKEVLRDVRFSDLGILYSTVAMNLPEIPQNLSPECKDFLEHCLCHRSRERWTADELLHHPFITNRDTTSPWPYGMVVPTSVQDSLLRPPRRNDPELPDGIMPARVKSHLDAVAKSWMPNLMVCAPNAPQGSQPQARAPIIDLTSTKSAAPAPAPAAQIIDLTSTPAPLPPLSPDVNVNSNSNLMDLLLGDNLAKTSSTQKSPRRRARTLTLPKAQRDETRDARGNSKRVQFNPVVEEKQFNDLLDKSSSLMEQVNEDIHAEARVAALQPLPEDDDDAAALLFPADIDLAWSPERRDEQRDVSPTPKRRPTFGIGCAGSTATDAVQPVPVVKKTRKK